MEKRVNIYVDFEGMKGLFEQAQKENRHSLFEYEVYELIRLSGGETIPRYHVLGKDERLNSKELLAIPGEKVVIKAISPYIVHKSDAGAVRIVPKETEQVLSAVRAMSYEVPEQYARSILQSPNLAPDIYSGLRGQKLTAAISRDIRGFLLVQHMPVSHEFGNELIVSLRETREFGMIISAGLGGTDTQLYTESLKKGQAVVAASTEMTNGEAFLDLFKETISYKKLGGLTRGQRRLVTDEQLLECFSALIAVGNYFSPAKADSPFVIKELEVNPFAFVNYLMLPLDGLCRFAPPRHSKVVPRPITKLNKLLHPSCIGVVGVSEREENVGRIIVRNILANGFAPARLHIVHPKASAIEGLPTVSSLAVLKEKLDLLILAVRADQAAELMSEVVDLDIAESVILIPGGLGEVAGSEEKGRHMQDRIHQAHMNPGGGPIVVGGNSLGVLSHPGRYDSLFIPEAKLPRRRGEYHRKSVFISQSGAFMITRMSRLPYMDPAYALSIGNQIDLTASDIVSFINQRPEIQTIAAYIEGLTTSTDLPLPGRFARRFIWEKKCCFTRLDAPRKARRPRPAIRPRLPAITWFANPACATPESWWLRRLPNSRGSSPCLRPCTTRPSGATVSPSCPMPALNALVRRTILSGKTIRSFWRPIPKIRKRSFPGFCGRPGSTPL
jgi:predicted CoA-binding protein